MRARLELADSVPDRLFSTGEHTAAVDVSDLAPGVYVLHAQVASEAGPATFSKSFTVAR
ncbi:MAG: hypothetical protein Rubg2KO_04860 [Rubricoccaceae bacterium]